MKAYSQRTGYNEGLEYLAPDNGGQPALLWAIGFITATTQYEVREVGELKDQTHWVWVQWSVFNSREPP